jgi:DNA-binding CsgD family transcriptional regulator
MSEDTLQETADKIGISKSTTFIAVKKIRKYLQNTIKSPFNG